MDSLQPARTLEEQAARHRLATTAVYFAAFIGLGLTNASTGPLLPLLADQVRVDLAGISILFTARSLGYLLGSLLSGQLYDRRSGHPVMAVSLVMAAVAIALVPATPLLWGLAAIMLLLGASEGSLDVGGNTLLIWLHGLKVAPFMNGLHFFFGLGALLSPLLILQALNLSGTYSWALWAMSLVLVPIALLLLRLPSPAATGHHSAERALEGGANGQIRQTHWGVVTLFVLFFVTAIGAEMSFGGWIYTFSVEAGLATVQSAAYLTSAFWAAFTISRLGSIPLARLIHPRGYVILGLAGATLGLLILNGMRFLETGSATQVALWLGTLLFGASIAVVFPTMLSYAGERTRIFGQVTGLFFVGVSVGGMLIPWLIGQFFEARGPYSVMVILLLATLAGVGLFALIDRKTRLAS